MTAALERGTIRLDQVFYCENGEWTVGRRRIRDAGRHGWLTPLKVVSRSSNIGIAKIARTVTGDELMETIRRFGFGARTGVELPGESPGSLASVDDWSGYTHDSIAFGHEIGVTVMQMGAALTAIANDGWLVQPRVALGTRDADGRLVRFERPPGWRATTPEVARTVASMLESVIADGTGKRAAIPGYRLAGKSGTAQKVVNGGYSETEFVASFGGFGPVDAPRLVGLVVLDTPRGERHQGGQVAAPVFGRVMAEALRHLRVPGEDVPSIAGGTLPERRDRPSVARGSADGRVPDVRGLCLRDAVSVLAEHGYHTVARGSGTVAAQQPSPGARLRPGSTCDIRLTRKAG